MIFSIFVFYVCSFIFFFQAEDGIRDDLVTGVQTCALPISSTTTITPSGCSRSKSVFAISEVSRSCSCSRRAKVSDRKSTRLNSCHQIISYAVFCLKKKKKKHNKLQKEKK